MRARTTASGLRRALAGRWLGGGSIRGRMLTGFGALVVLGAAMIVAVYVEVRVEMVHDEWIEQVGRTLGQARQAESDVHAMQAGYRGFLITGDDRVLEPYLRGRKDLAERVAAVAYLTPDPAVVARFQALRERVRSWEQSVIQPGISLRRSYPDGVRSWVGSGVGVEHANRIGQLLEQTIADLGTALEARRQARLVARERLHAILGIGGATAAALALLVAFGLSESTSRRLRTLAAAAERLHERAPAPEAQGVRQVDEIGRVNAVLDSLRYALLTLESQSRAVAAGNLNDPVLDSPAPGKIGVAFGNMVGKLRHTVETISNLANGDLKVNVVPAGDNDTVGEVTGRLVSSLRNKDEDLRTRGIERERLLESQRFEGRLHRALDMARTDHDVMQVVRDVVEYRGLTDGVEVLMADESRAHMSRAMCCMPGPDAFGCDVPSPKDCNALRSAHAQTFASSRDFDACPHFRGRGGERELSAACVPVNVMGRAWGVLHVISPRDWSGRQHDLDFLSLLAARIGERLSVVRAFARSQAQAATDPLTGLMNRRALSEEMQALAARNQDYAVSYSDLDHFKSLNDKFGHDMGDRALRLFAKVLQDTLRPGDLIGRWGGEEFVIVLPGASLEQAVAALDRVREQLAAALNSGSTPPFTASFGVAEGFNGEALDAVLTAADGALLEAKRRGRNRVVCARDLAEPVGSVAVAAAAPAAPVATNVARAGEALARKS